MYILAYFRASSTYEGTDGGRCEEEVKAGQTPVRSRVKLSGKMRGGRVCVCVCLSVLLHLLLLLRYLVKN